MKKTKAAVGPLRASVALLGVLLLVLAAGCGKKTIRIDTVPPGATVELVQDERKVDYPEYYQGKYTTPANFRLKQKAHSIKISRLDHDSVRKEIIPQPLSFWQKITLQGLFRKGNLLPVYSFTLAPTLDERLRTFAQEYARELRASLPGGVQSVGVYPFINGNMEVTELGKRFAGHLSFALQQETGYAPRLYEFNSVRRYLVENSQGLGARALGAGEDLSFYANQLGIDVIIVGRIRKEGAGTSFWKFEAFVIDPQSGSMLASFAKTLPPDSFGDATGELDALYAQVEPYIPPPLRQEIKTAANRLAVKLLEGYELRAGGQKVNVKFTDFDSDPAYWGAYAREEFQKRLLSDGRGMMMAVPEHHEETDLGFDAGRRQTNRPQLLSAYQLSIVGDVALRDDQVVLNATLRAPNGDVWMMESAEFTLSDPGIQRREWNNPQ